MSELIIADKQDITKAGLLFLSQKLNGFKTISEVKNKEELIQRLTLDPEAVVVIDYILFDFVDIEELLEIKERFQQAKWILFSENLNDDILNKLIFNTHSFSAILKSCSNEEITCALKCSTCGERFICNRICNKLLTINNPGLHTQNKLTPAERDILKEIASGKTTKEIAHERNLSFHTILTHRKNIFRKIGVRNAYEATKYAIRTRIIYPNEYLGEKED
ncbi:response regulator transcription factor [uncultured Sanguibacteroides sp.]|uniref:response regulator transcription factor n=1 Tax=uncultured Sanguibacteroides sp. TaxID=1635151 RepID=UPI0025CE5BAB|nr:response regulator transcription factor [uncultured Sanguibacteroides sp.]